MHQLQAILDYAAIAPILIAVGLFIEYAWKRSAAVVQIPVSSKNAPAPTPPSPSVEQLVIPDPVTLADELIQVCKDTSDINDLLSIPATPKTIEVPDCALIPLAKLYSVPGSSKWGRTRKLRQSERSAVMAAIAEVA